ncbi:MAG: class I SAM-dependent methyltransferase, partial [Collimonas pratensis]|uniref:class I SAM-dependent methyltransferase n=1 Tax=Collimonas pratensis TaxID=279113 RepID=UPI003C7925F9
MAISQCGVAQCLVINHAKLAEAISKDELKNMSLMFPDPWLDRWLSLIKTRSGDRPVLEIGCGYGDDTSILANVGLQVIGFDLSAEAVAATRSRVPSAHVEQGDVRDCQCRSEDVPNGALKVYQSGLIKRAVEALDLSLFNSYFTARQ